MAYDESESRLVIVGEDGRSGKAQTSQQLAAALSVSVWDLSNMQQPLLVCTTGSKQVHSLLQILVHSASLHVLVGRLAARDILDKQIIHLHVNMGFGHCGSTGCCSGPVDVASW